MHFLLANDDGIQAIGLRALSQAILERGHSVVVRAPQTQQSAVSHHITLFAPLMMREVPWEGDNAKAYSVAGTPADCVRIAQMLTDKPFDFAFSGINNGENAGTAVYYSGTVSAAREARMLNMPAMAVSIMPHADEAMRLHLARLAVRIAERYQGDALPRLCLINLNAPALPARRLRLALCSILTCLVFVLMSSCMSHGSAGLEPTAEDKLLKAPVAPGYSFAFSTPRSQWQAGTMPHIYQIDPAWSELPYAGGTIRQNACGPTCLTMVYIFKTGRIDMTPVDMCALSEAGNYAPTGATEWSFMTSGAWQLGLNGTELHNDRDSMTQALRSGAPVIAAVRPGTFTNVGHYIVLYGIDDADQIEVFDPNSASRSARRWGVVEVLNEVEAMWAYY